MWGCTSTNDKWSDYIEALANGGVITTYDPGRRACYNPDHEKPLKCLSKFPHSLPDGERGQVWPSSDVTALGTTPPDRRPSALP